MPSRVCVELEIQVRSVLFVKVESRLDEAINGMKLKVPELRQESEEI